MNTTKQLGHDFISGAIHYVLRVLLIWAVLLIIYACARNIFGWGLDSTDIDGWHRSGLRVHIDAKTGIEYLSDGRGGLIRRYTNEATP